MARAGTTTALVAAVALVVGLTACGTEQGRTPTDAAPLTTSSSSAPSDAPATSTSTTAPAPPTTAAPTTAPPTTGDAPLPATALVDRLRVAEPDPSLPRYERDRFGDDWAYDPATKCNTRERVLAAEAVELRGVDEACRPTGTWVSSYDGVRTDDPADLQIDHLVPLADAWRSGASSWTDERRRAFANHLDHPEELIAVTGSTNQSKSDSTPDEWLPPDRGSWCAYASDWVQVKARWDLSVTPAEKATLVQLLSGC